MAQLTKEEIRTLARDEVRAELDIFRHQLTQAEDARAEATANSAKALQRLLLIVVGDPELRVPGLLSDVEILKEARQTSIVERAKLSGMWIVISAVALALGRFVWYLLDHVFK